jgi:RimJ/RimL family protein N-acetyltransferase
VKGQERIDTTRLALRRPALSDAEAIFARYSSDADVTKYLSWPRHRSIEQTRAFLAFSEAEWNRWPAGPYLIASRDDGKLLGGTGLAFETATVATTGYVLARDAWGHGYATEALAAMVVLARNLGVRRLHALCHPEHAPSIRVLEKCGFALQDRLREFAHFPNLGSGDHTDCLRYVCVPDASHSSSSIH